MAKRTRYPNRTTAKQQAKRAQRSAAARPDAAPDPIAGTSAREDQPETRPVTGGAPARRPAPGVVPVPHDHADDGPARPSSAALTEAELRRAEELEAEVKRQEKAAITEQLRKRARADEIVEREYTGDPNQPLSVRAAHEYAYVGRDVKRIAVTGGLMLGILAVLHVLINVLGVVTI